MSANSRLRAQGKIVSLEQSAGVFVLFEVPLLFSICYYSGISTPTDTPKKKGINTEINCIHRSCLGCASLLFSSQNQIQGREMERNSSRWEETLTIPSLCFFFFFLVEDK